MPLALVPKSDVYLITTVFNTVDRFAGAEAAPKPWTQDTRFDQLDYDSLARVELAMEMEDELDTTFPDNAIELAETIGDVIKIVREKLA